MWREGMKKEEENYVQLPLKIIEHNLSSGF